MGFYFDQTRCHGCSTCEVACKDWHNIQDEAVIWRRIITIEDGGFPDIFVAFLPLCCLHCAQPACAEACPVDAITKRPDDGLMVVDSGKCLGKECGLCQQACPYQIPQFGSEDSATMEMCNFCLDRLMEGKKPVCVDACPMHALDFGPLDELEGKYGMAKDTTGFVYSAEVKPAIVFKPKTGRVDMSSG
jgi:anaerobic dimethyl sulfoxide reductase subunit B (iron-sulfur subunit)